MLKILVLSILLCGFSLIELEGYCATPSETSVTDEKAVPPPSANGQDEEKDKNAESEAQEEKKDPNVFESQYYTVTLTPGWSMVTPPTENQGTVTSIFKSSSGSIVIMLVSGNLGGADLKTITDMFAEQFRAQKQPVLKNGRYTFSFLRDGKPCEAYIASADDLFMITTITGNKKEALDFIKHQVKSPEFSQLLPQ